MNDLIRTHEALALIGVAPRTFTRLAAEAGITPAYRATGASGRPAYWRRREIEALRDRYRCGSRVVTITQEQIDRAIKELDEMRAWEQVPHASESADSVRIAYQWLDAQRKTKQPNRTIMLPLKHIIESWGGRYVSRSDVIVAAHLHPEIKGRYPEFNIYRRPTRPNRARLEGIAEAGIHSYSGYQDIYARDEEV